MQCVLAAEVPSQRPRSPTVSGAKWTALQVPATGKPGFTLLAPEQTGLRFTNTLDEWQGASNRVLFNGSGLAAGDFDKDGLPDLYFCSLNGRNTLYKNLGQFQFAEVTEQAGLRRDQRVYRGAVFADINGDDALDLLVCVLGDGVECWLNDGKGRFTDNTAAARTGSRFGSATLALADVDGNGTLDLYVANNRTDDIRDRGQVNLRMVDGKMAIPPELQDRLVMVKGQLQEYGEPDQLMMNDGRGRFTTVSWTGGRFRNEDGLPLSQPPLDWALAAMFRDVNDDGAPDLYVCNDFWTPDRFWLNDGKGRFRAASRFAIRNMSASSMGVDFADIDRDGDFDFFVVDMLSRDPRLRKRQKLAQTPMSTPIGVIEDRPQFMRNTLFVNRGDGTFAEIANYAGVAASDWSWTPIFLDVDLDGYEDLLIGAGHVKDVQDLDAIAAISARQHSWSGYTNDVERQKAFTKELMEHMRRYPPLEMPIFAFRNRGDLRFEETTSQWGTDQQGVHHAIALADFDLDGDLDFAVNNLGSGASIYRNESTASRLAVRLRGLPGNTQGIGAKVTVREGPVAVQSQEMISGGRYMAGSEPLLVFAAGANPMEIEVTWRSGKRSFLTNALPNRLYEIEESSASALNLNPNPNPARLFADASDFLKHTHYEQPFDDFARQPMLPRRLSQPGPPIAWFDINGDGRDDLLIGSGRGGQLTCYRNRGEGGFQRVEQPVPSDTTALLGLTTPNGSAALLAAFTGYESATNGGLQQFDLPQFSLSPFPRFSPSSSSGPIALADLEGDGDLDLFIGGRALAGRYPEAATSQIYRAEDGQWRLDSTSPNVLTTAGIINGAVWSDLTDDGFPELILACEWGPITVFRNERGRLTPWDPPIRQEGKGEREKGGKGEQAPGNADTPVRGHLSLSHYTGWWQGVTTGDLDGDGRLDIVAANWGLNSDYVATFDHPLELYYGDVLDRGVLDLIETEWDPATRQTVPRRGLDFLGRHFPGLTERFRTHKAFSDASIDAVLGPEKSRWRKAAVTTLASAAFLNRGDHFEMRPLPPEAQWSSAFAVNIADFDGDGHEDVFLSQNFFATQPETPRLDAGRGLLLRGDATGDLQPLQNSGIEIYGEQRGAAAADFDADGRVDLAVSQNGAATKLYHNRGAKPGLRVWLVGPKANPHGVGAALRIETRKADTPMRGPVREIHAGSGYCSQDSAVQVLSIPALSPTYIWVRWPGGQTSTTPVPPGARNLSVTMPQ
jgi:enediyne biosynthesis protein E4